MKVLVDCDVVLDVAASRQPHFSNSKGVLDWCENHPGSGLVAWHTVANVYYLLKNGHDDVSKRQFLRGLLDFMEVAPTGTAEAKHALGLSMKDFEDAMQAAAAVAVGADVIVTRNGPDFGSSPVSAMAPGDFLAIAPT